MSYRGIISDITGTSWSTARIYSNPPPNCKHNASTPLVWHKHTSTLQSKPDWSLFLDPKACEQDIPASQSDIFTLSSHQSTQSSNSLLMVLVEEKINKSPVLPRQVRGEGRENFLIISGNHLKSWEMRHWPNTELHVLWAKQGLQTQFCSLCHDLWRKEMLHRVIVLETKRNCNVTSP